ncbi:cell division ATP-binding protein FtsE [Candidatus Woesebacteria bacterium GWC2_33_12]|nr:MAG: cell-division associated ABC transporter ATP binding FtsE subunit [Candidatus Woesebacteria bacterium GW2011_GWC2_33_12]OGM07065.1 MAG: cell division ATP-binding protein FtsE [Candidatus Woesebacteria bacterium GWC2_33_12]OGM87380.1 MAG: cell division ATP-binding protein FtsE [Candidatus Woesebacteria bacterium RIFOXYD1_FULL_33_11]HCR36422.1 cell division ATP-binding protein FtsE [Candidatus Woesebacteria bacterium]
MISFQNVTKNFGSINALEDITFEVKDGEFVFLTGPSGAGKSTILKLILREILADSGKVLFDDVDLSGLSNKDIPRLRQQMGIVFQDFKVLPERTVSENVEVALAVSDVPSDEWDKRVNHVLKLVGLDKRANLFPNQLSGGELQRVSLARALVINPKIILADEPTGNLDWKTAEGIMELLEQINKEGKTIIMATHHEGIIKHAKHRTIKLDDGKIIKT